MANVDVHIWHDVTGQIVAVGRPMGGRKCIPMAGENQFVVETQVADEHIARLHETHVVNSARRLVRRSDKKD